MLAYAATKIGSTYSSIAVYNALPSVGLCVLHQHTSQPTRFWWDSPKDLLCFRVYPIHKRHCEYAESRAFVWCGKITF